MDVPFDVLLAIAPAYDSQNMYSTLATDMAAEVMAEIRRDGMEAVLRDRFHQFIPVQMDFGNREAVLHDRYQRALDKLATVLK